MSSLVNKLLFLAFVVKGRGFVELKARLGPLKKCVDSKAAYGVSSLSVFVGNDDVLHLVKQSVFHSHVQKSIR